MVHALEVFEIRQHVGKYLPRRSLLASLRVSRSWHDSLLAQLWSEVDLRPNPNDRKVVAKRSKAKRALRLPSVEQVQEHAHLVRKLSIHDFLSLPYSIIDFTGLLELDIDAEEEFTRLGQGHPAKHNIHMERIILNNPQLEVIRIRSPYCYLVEPFWKACHDQALDLEFLSIYDTFIPPEAAPWFWKTVAQCKAVELNDVGTVDLWSMSSPPDFSKIQRISFKSMDSITPADTWKTMALCTNATSIEWQGYPEMRKFNPTRFFIPGTMRNVRQLKLDIRITDHSLSVLLDFMEPLTSLDIEEMQLERSGCISLRRHFPTLEHLNIRECPYANSPFIQEVLSSCPSLKSLMADSLHARDTFNGRPWVCIELEKWHVSVDIRSRHGLKRNDHQAIFARLGQLQKLKVLDLSLHTQPYYNEGERSIELKLPLGLSALSGLERLRELRLGKTRQWLETRDVLWMVNQWPLLKLVQGNLHNKSEINGELKAVLRQHKVEWAEEERRKWW
ncbi:hypothetical protein BG011_002279 [Mortierella polycephala]|uniref:F-box domain-containing protein n=1 Tax=Mortierella polycephala TaxID=41804 RepID=A0A9P6Q3L8_9FUNG|nr:hypothetical protein BG011_002279 [Mortierella polycephala]